MVQSSAQDILDFWFSEDVKAHWFARSDDLDKDIVRRFSDVYQQAIAGELSGWQADARSALALVIILDQFPRNMFRGTPQAFASDAQARDLAKLALDKTYDQMVEADARPFFYLPLMHSEVIEDQERCVKLYEVLDNASSLGFARVHRDIVKQFGRFPHRNSILGRENTPEETEFLKTHKGF